jgi:hypothetical protein
VKEKIDSLLPAENFVQEALNFRHQRYLALQIYELNLAVNGTKFVELGSVSGLVAAHNVDFERDTA